MGWPAAKEQRCDLAADPMPPWLAEFPELERPQPHALQAD
jgi:hypothetical protein